jgi:DNA processing protein
VRGADSTTLRGALSGGGSTFAVLGCGADIIDPSEHTGFARDIETHLIVSKRVPAAEPNHQGSVPSRGGPRSGEKSGFLITARSALEQGRDVLAVPETCSIDAIAATHARLKDGAKIVESVDDTLEELDLPGRPDVMDASGAGSTGFPCPSSADPILRCLVPGQASDLDAISERSGLGPARRVPRLFELGLHGLVARAGGRRFIRS